MVESPTYYHSLSPVLQSLKEFDMEIFPLQEEVIYAKAARELPDYLKEATFHTAIVCSSKKTRSTAEGSQEGKPEKEKDSSNSLETGEEVIPEEAMDTESADSSCELDSDSEACSESLSSSSESLPSYSSCVSDEPVDTLPHFWEEIAFSARKDSDKKSINVDNVLMIMPSMCGMIDPGEVERALANDVPEKQIDTDLTSECTEPQHRATQENLGGRMNVERFLEIFNSSSESSLEASQCDALVHALKNRLAVIQGE
jgi:hypothetical protein